MHIIRDIASMPASCRGAAIALGNFDGVHLGHRAILQRCIDMARKAGTPAAAMTFEPHPREFLAPGRESLRICSLRHKLSLMRQMGIDAVFLMRFNRALAGMSAASFVEDLLHGQLGAEHVVTGYNFAFGHNREGSIELLGDMAGRLGFGFSFCPPVMDAVGKPVSSSAIRQLLAAGEMEKADELLGRPYRMEGRVAHGEKRGRELGFPTANLPLGKRFKPRFGVYAVRFRLGDEAAWHDGVASIGVKPTFGDYAPLLEVHALDMARDMYGQCMQVDVLHFLREEARFEQVDALKMQMEQDCMQARKRLKEC